MTDKEAAARMEAQRVSVNWILSERANQARAFGVQKHDPAYWLAILAKQVGQLGSAAVLRNWAPDEAIRSASDLKIYREAGQVAAVALALMEAIRMSELGAEITTAVPEDARLRARALDVDDEDLIRYEEVGK